ncbi:hypothetical protein SLS56_007226 [Neofusicoccum ribis]|uniref:Berberine/berberine-like domain-containing protein n=1 Tax=Neofusicoccum ribis TaxID=45134 RepID=A0ABR3SNF1_9PEZI
MPVEALVLSDQLSKASLHLRLYNNATTQLCRSGTVPANIGIGPGLMPMHPWRRRLAIRFKVGCASRHNWRKTRSDRPPDNPLIWLYWTLTGGYAVYIVTASTFTLQVLTLPDGTGDDISSHLRAIVADPRYSFNGLAVNNPNWKEDYFGENYARLREIKAEWDPEGLFYGKTTVGSDEWEIDDEGRFMLG